MGAAAAALSLCRARADLHGLHERWPPAAHLAAGAPARRGAGARLIDLWEHLIFGADFYCNSMIFF